MPPQALDSTVKNMENWGVLARAGETARGAPRYVLDPGWIPDLRAAIKRNGPEFSDGQRLMWIRPGDSRKAGAALVGHGSSEVAWAASLGKIRGMLVGLDDGVGDKELASLKETMERAGAACDVGPVDDVVRGDEFEAFVRGLRELPGDSD